MALGLLMRSKGVEIVWVAGFVQNIWLFKPGTLWLFETLKRAAKTVKKKKQPKIFKQCPYLRGARKLYANKRDSWPSQ